MQDDGDNTLASEDAIVADFLAARALNPAEPLEKFLPDNSDPDAYRRSLRALVLSDIGLRTSANPSHLRRIFQQFPLLQRDLELAAEVIATDRSKCQELGQKVTDDDYKQLIPELYQEVHQEIAIAVTQDAGPNSLPTKTTRSGKTIGDFAIQKLIAEGGHAKVYLAKQLSLDRDLALKISSQMGIEGKTLAKLQHPNIVAVYSEQQIDQQSLLAMQLVDGPSLEQWLKSHDKGQLRTVLNTPQSKPRYGTRQGSLAVIANIILDVARGLSHAHRKHILHCDIKPANILLEQSGKALIADFHIAAHSPSDSATQSSDSSAEVIGGTIAYMSPEHLRAILPWSTGEDQEVDERSDIYSLGVVFYEAVFGSRPWQEHANGWERAEINQVLAERVRTVSLKTVPHQSRRNLPPALLAIIRKCLAPAPQDRYAHASDLVNDLERFLTYRPLVSAENTSVRERCVNWLRRNSVNATAAGLFVAATMGVFAIEYRNDSSKLDKLSGLLSNAKTLLNENNLQEGSDKLGEARGVFSDGFGFLAGFVFERELTNSNVQLERLSKSLTNLRASQAEVVLLGFRAQALSSKSMVQTQDPANHPLNSYHVLTKSDWEMSSPFKELSLDRKSRVRNDITELLVGAAFSANATSENQPSRNQILSRLPNVHQKLPLILALQSLDPQELINTKSLQQAAESDGEKYLLATIAVNLKDYQLAASLLEPLLQPERRGPGHPSRTTMNSALPIPEGIWPRFLLACSYQELGRNEEAIECYGMCAGRQPRFAWTYFNLGLLYAKIERLDLAEEQMRRALSVDADFGQAHGALGAVLLANEKFDAAEESLTRAISLGQSSAETYLNRASARYGQRKIKSAMADVTHALSLEPDNDKLKQLQSLLQAATQQPR